MNLYFNALYMHGHICSLFTGAGPADEDDNERDNVLLWYTVQDELEVCQQTNGLLKGVP